MLPRVHLTTLSQIIAKIINSYAIKWCPSNVVCLADDILIWRRTPSPYNVTFRPICPQDVHLTTFSQIVAQITNFHLYTPSIVCWADDILIWRTTPLLYNVTSRPRWSLASQLPLEIVEYRWQLDNSSVPSCLAATITPVVGPSPVILCYYQIQESLLCPGLLMFTIERFLCTGLLGPRQFTW